MIHLDLFSGLGLFSYAADHVWNLEHVFCEIEPWPRKFLRQTYPGSVIHEDIRKLDGTRYAGRTFLLTAGVPCQPASVAGKQRGTGDDRWLWPEALRVLKETRPTWAIFENPNGILSLEGGLVFENLLLEMEDAGYEVQPYIIPACAVGAVHRRDRVWIVAHSRCTHDQRESESRKRKAKTKKRHNGQFEQSIKNDRTGIVASHSNGTRSQGHRKSGERAGQLPVGETDWQEPWPKVAARLCRVDVSFTDGVYETRRERDRNERIKALGNTIMWEVAYQLMLAIDNA